ncbi:hypothetical protein BEWA_026110 [Theileria equi strain WA]|uniref:Uncharacterized protein n=1 Tax=Theileria equi strain WA TaxID=1537102 RepID=L0AVY2_THEEQ|nr:hypothetical protein BEWA_026110 [Theileria equi strain WA]AFZ79762.1 hypothetical protein BEWA_026110 [Theileria equi strain WA]|eukprot:XP_004829428.1 hypothetical protein BEWA_026110 [Theileria equi strain WA]
MGSDSLQGVARVFASEDGLGTYTLNSDPEDVASLDYGSMHGSNLSVSRDGSIEIVSRTSSKDVNQENVERVPSAEYRSSMEMNREGSVDSYGGAQVVRRESLHSSRLEDSDFIRPGTRTSIVSNDAALIDGSVGMSENDMERGSTFGLRSMYASREMDQETSAYENQKSGQYGYAENDGSIHKMTSGVVPDLINEANTLQDEIEDIFKQLDEEHGVNALVGTDDSPHMGSPCTSNMNTQTSMSNRDSHDACTSTFTPREVERKALVRLRSELDKLKEKLKYANQTDNTIVKKNSVAWEITDSLLKEEEIKKKIEEKQAELEREIARCRLSKGPTLRDYYTKWAEKRGKFGKTHEGPVCTCVPQEHVHAQTIHFNEPPQYTNFGNMNTHSFRIPMDESTLPTVVPIMYSDGDQVACTCGSPTPSSVYVRGTWNPRDGTIRISNNLNVESKFCKLIDSSHTNDQDPVNSTRGGDAPEDTCVDENGAEVAATNEVDDFACKENTIEHINVDTQCNLSSSRTGSDDDDDFYKSMKNAQEPCSDDSMRYSTLNQAQYSDFSPHKSERALLANKFKSLNDFYEYERDEYYDTSGPCPANLKNMDVYGKECKHYHYHTHYGGKKHRCKHSKKCKRKHRHKDGCKHRKEEETLVDVTTTPDVKSQDPKSGDAATPFCGFGFYGCTGKDVLEESSPASLASNTPLNIPIGRGAYSDASSSYSSCTNSGQQTPMCNPQVMEMIKKLPVFNRNVAKKKSDKSPNSLAIRIPVYTYKGMDTTPTSIDASAYSHSGDFTFRGEELGYTHPQQSYQVV